MITKNCSSYLSRNNSIRQKNRISNKKVRIFHWILPCNTWSCIPSAYWHALSQRKSFSCFGHICKWHTYDAKIQFFLENQYYIIILEWPNLFWNSTKINDSTWISLNYIKLSTCETLINNIIRKIFGNIVFYYYFCGKINILAQWTE